MENMTTPANTEIEKYCKICKKTCGHWAKEHDAVFGDKKLTLSDKIMPWAMQDKGLIKEEDVKKFISNIDDLIEQYIMNKITWTEFITKRQNLAGDKLI